MNAIQFFAAQLEAEERFRNALESFMKQFEVKNADSEIVQEGEREGRRADGSESGNISGGNDGSY